MNTILQTTSVAEYFNQAYAPQFLANVNQKSVRKYLRVIERAGDFVGHELQFTDISDKLTTGLSEYLVANGMKPDSASDFRQCLRVGCPHF